MLTIVFNGENSFKRTELVVSKPALIIKSSSDYLYLLYVNRRPSCTGTTFEWSIHDAPRSHRWVSRKYRYRVIRADYYSYGIFPTAMTWLIVKVSITDHRFFFFFFHISRCSVFITSDPNDSIIILYSPSLWVRNDSKRP